jgi:hypothetical protein
MRLYVHPRTSTTPPTGLAVAYRTSSSLVATHSVACSRLPIWRDSSLEREEASDCAAGKYSLRYPNVVVSVRQPKGRGTARSTELLMAVCRTMPK